MNVVLVRKCFARIISARPLRIYEYGNDDDDDDDDAAVDNNNRYLYQK